MLIPAARAYGEIPHDALVNPIQAESALGHLQADEHDDESLDSPDKDIRAEEEALLGRNVNPVGVDYTCLVPKPEEMSEYFGWTASDGDARPLSATDFTVDAQDMEKKLSEALSAQAKDFEQQTMSAEAARVLEERIESLDPTQREIHNIVTEWATQRKLWDDDPRRRAAEPTVGSLQGTPPKLQLLMLGTAGTGKTHTAKTFIMSVRRT